MHIVFINYNNFTGNSGLHIHPLANELIKLGNKATVFVPENNPENTEFTTPSLYEVRTFYDISRLSHEGDILFIAWTPREIVRKKTLELSKKYNAPYIIHLEDNEEQIVSDNLKKPFSQLMKKSTEELDKIVPLNLSHPHRYKNFLSSSKGVTCIIDTLEEFVPHHIPAITFWPACEEEVFDLSSELNKVIKEELGIPPNAAVIFYPGNMHASNVREVSELYKAVELVNISGKEVILLRAGTNHVPFELNVDNTTSFYMELGEKPSKQILEYLSIADILIQPGTNNSFNNYRFPSKLPMFLASGRPVITSDTNIGKHLNDWEHCLKFVHGNPEELAHKIKLLMDHKQVAKQIGQNGRLFAKKNFSWKKSAEKLLKFYSKITGY